MFGGNRAESFLAEHPGETYVIGGHSLGGVFASRYAAAHTDQIKGFFYLASYADDGGRLDGTNLSALQLTGSNDGVLNWEAWEKVKTNLPKNTTFGCSGTERMDEISTKIKKGP
ncbi:alpha/beta hydrolase [Paenibacillus sp. QZ-Y1]|uniref:alpha/beta hydrolase n=1 Tax=Paenibacillus sp. QZ-Y1 TaxID=3414511 RepID=UPI003F7913A5